MKGLGVAVLAVGIIGLFYALGLDASVDSGYGRVNNIGLLNQKQNYVIASGVLAIIGAIIFGFSLFAPAKAKTPKSATGKAKPNIFSAIVRGDAQAVRESISSGIDLNQRSVNNGMTPLEYSNSLGRKEITAIIESHLQADAASSVTE